MRWISTAQQRRDHAGLRYVCAADGRDATTADPLVVTRDGYRMHQSHTTDPSSAFYGEAQPDNERSTTSGLHHRG